MILRSSDFCEDVKTHLGPEIRVVFDVGANFGQTTKLLSQHFPAARIYSFEPVEETYDHLISNTHDLSGVECFQIGFSDRPGTYEIFVQPHPGENSIEKNVDSGRGTTKISLETIDSFCSRNGILKIYLLKTDTEGHDLCVLRGAQSMLDQKCISAVYSEFGFYRDDRGHTNLCDLLYFMQANDYQLYNYYRIGSSFRDHPPYRDYPWANALFIKNSIIREIYADEYLEWLRKIGILPTARTSGGAVPSSLPSWTKITSQLPLTRDSKA